MVFMKIEKENLRDEDEKRTLDGKGFPINCFVVIQKVVYLSLARLVIYLSV